MTALLPQTTPPVSEDASEVVPVNESAGATILALVALLGAWFVGLTLIAFAEGRYIIGGCSLTAVGLLALAARTLLSRPN
ncbi:hypothetical protein V6N00_12625 [Tersicoccus sp. MR15.9]|uniref:hypothetical protein n=1 Tax=Tersicoccus mangrovi TaxID=3121635 RepID=UPI002FE62E8B